jgi:hypothetical protein
MRLNDAFVCLQFQALHPCKKALSATAAMALLWSDAWQISLQPWLSERQSATV